MFTRLFSPRRARLLLLLAACLCAVPSTSLVSAGADPLPVLHLRKAASPPPLPPLPALLQDPAVAGAWYAASPTWFGDGGLTGDRNHVEVLATYDSTALYLAFLVLDRSPNFTLTGGAAALLYDRNVIWIQTPAGRTFSFGAQPSAYYGGGGVYQSGEMTNPAAFDPAANALPGWQIADSTAGYSWQEMLTIPWSALGSGPPAPGARWRFNLLNDNQYGPATAITASTLNVEQWAPGDATQPSQWGTLAFDEGQFTPPPGISPEATLTLRPATGFGGEANVSPGDNAATNDVDFGSGGVIQSDWNDWDPVNFERKELLQFDLSMIPPGRVILSATLDNFFYAPFEIYPSDLFVHVERLAGPYDPGAVTMLTSPLPLENGDRELVHSRDVSKWVNFDVSAAVTAALAAGQSKLSLALTGSSGDISNGKAWVWSWGRADWFDQLRPRLHITFGQPGIAYPTPVQVGSLNSVSAAGPGDKNKLTNGTFRYGALEGVSNTTYWQDPGSIFLNNRNVALLHLAGDVNTATGDPAARLLTPVGWDVVQQTVTGLTPGRTYTFSAWVRSSAPGQISSLKIVYLDAGGNTVASDYRPYTSNGTWGQTAVTLAAPTGTASAVLSLTPWTPVDTNGYLLFSDLQMEAGTSPTAYAETMGVYYPDHPRTDARSAVATPVLNGASFVSQSVPTTMTTGQSYPVSVTYKNTGTTTWNSATLYRLGSQSPADNATWTPGNRVLLPSTVAPGQSVTFAFTVTAPASAGTYPFGWRMVQDGVQWFGDFTPVQSVNVTASTTPVNGAAFVSQSVPATMTAKQSYPASVTIKNTGTTTWIAATQYRLGSQSPQDNATWTASNRVVLPSTVAPGQSVTFAFTVTAPASAGTYPFGWRMVRDGVQWFGDFTPAQSVAVH